MTHIELFEQLEAQAAEEEKKQARTFVRKADIAESERALLEAQKKA